MAEYFNFDMFESELRKLGAELIRYTNISGLPISQRQGFTKAIIIGIPMSKEFIIDKRAGINKEPDEFYIKEKKTDHIAECAAEYLINQGYRAYAQSEENNTKNGFFNNPTKTSTLPHKTIAILSGLGWIGKNDLLVTKDYGCAFTMCTVLTDAPIEAAVSPLMDSGCKDCNICLEICPPRVITGNEWSQSETREHLVDVYHCECCIKCMVYCKWTNYYIHSTETSLK